MRLRLFFILLAILGIPRAATAQVFTDVPLCVTILNTADIEMTGSLQTDQHTDENNKISYHDFVFRLQPGEKREACSTGPFFPGQQLRLVAKTSFPVYSCKIDMNRIVTIASHVEPDGTRVFSADCPSERDQLQAR